MQEILQKIKNNEKGLSLIEVLVVVFIITIMSTAMFLGRGSIDSNQKTIMSTQKFASDIRKIQSFTLNLKENNGDFPVGGWGMTVNIGGGDEDTYILFGDANENKDYDPGEMYLKKLKFPRGIKIDKIMVYDDSPIPGTGLQVYDLRVMFVPPDPTAFICDSFSGCTSDRAEIFISNDDGTISKIIEINRYGLVDIKNN